MTTQWRKTETSVLIAIGVVLFLIFCLSPTAQGYNPYYLPLTQAELAKRIPQKKIHCPGYNSGDQIKIGAATVHEVDGELRISGKDKRGHPWKVSGLFNYWGCEIYISDLDHNGTQDLIVVTYNSANGLAPNVELGILLFESNGRPVFSDFIGYFETDAQGVKDYLDLNNDGHTQLICQSFDDGYWITSLYEARDSHWFPVHGGHGSRTYPLYTRFTYRPNHVATIPKAGRNPQYADLSNNAILDQAPVTIDKLLWANVKESENPTFIFSDGRTCSPVAWYGTLVVVVDQDAGRKSATLSDPEDSKQLLDTIVHDKLPVRISGHRPPREDKSSDCAPELIWAGNAPVRQ